LGVLGIILLILATSPWRRFRRHHDDDGSNEGPDGDDSPRPSNFELLPGSDQD
jgi:hypothetical protein